MFERATKSRLSPEISAAPQAGFWRCSRGSSVLWSKAFALSKNTSGNLRITRAAKSLSARDQFIFARDSPVETLAKKSISNFKLRKDQAIGAKVTLRGERMYEFLERFIKAALPRIRDFRGVSPRCFDNNGNYTLGISDQSIFPEIELDKIKRNIGFDVTIVTTARTDEEAKSLLSEMGMPFSDRARKPATQAA